MRAAVLLLVGTILGGAGCTGEFDLGVGAFEVGSNEAILWTHWNPTDPDRYLAVLQVELARDAEFSEDVRIRGAFAWSVNDFTTRVKVRGLDPGTRYYYRFRTKDEGLMVQRSPIGSFQTAPAQDDGSPVRFVVSGDSNLGYTAPRGLDFYVLSAAAAEAPDFFVYFGDTIYADSGILPGGADAFSLDEYRQVHRMTRADPHLQSLLAATGTFTGWDDHEVRNDYDGETVDPEQFTNGARAFFEYLPQRRYPAFGPYITHRAVRWGKHLELFYVDGRQFRSAELFCNAAPTPDGPQTTDTLFSPFPQDEEIALDILGPLASLTDSLLKPSDPECVDGILADPDRTVLGADQMIWLEQALLASTASFKVIVNNTPISNLFFLPYDRWEGYPAERTHLTDFLAENFDPGEVLILTTDFHTNLAIKRDDFSEVIVGPIGQSTFASGVISQLPPELGPLAPLIFPVLDSVIAEANGVPAVAGSQPDAFSYGVVEVFEDDAGTPRLKVIVRGDTDYLSGDNDPAKVTDLFTVDLP